jgi:predicted ribosomally synthesized peptide with SipW-like signal peptide
MSDKNIISRRSVLSALGVAGAGAALGGVGTQAFFSDQETFEDNQLVAGSLDMKVDWEEHYSDWSEDETEGVDYQMLNTSEEVPEGYKGYPQLRNQSLAINDSDVGQFMNNTAVEAFPDANGDNLVDRGGIACDEFGDVPDDLEAPVIDLDDVKPGDFGEVTFSFHLCDNPGYVWMNGVLTADEEVSVTEPEADDPQEDNEPGGTFEAGDGELAESVQAAVWYDDDCDNVRDERVGNVDVVLAIDRSGSLSSDEWDQIASATESAIDQLDDSDTVGMVLFGDAPQAVDFGTGQFLQSVGGNRAAIKAEIPGSAPPSENATHMPGAIDFANWILDNQGMNDKQAMVVLTDGEPNYQNGVVDDGATPPSDDTDDQLPVDFEYTGGSASENSTISQSELDETVDVATSAKSDGTQIVTVGLDTNDAYLRDNIATSPSNHFGTDIPANLENIYDVIIQGLTTQEKVLCQGSLREVLADLNTNEGRGLPLDAARDEVEPGVYDYDEKADPEDDPDRECYPAVTTACVAFEWWLPLDHANEIQTDRAEFDLGFYTEQCRHNDGSGMVPETEQPIDTVDETTPTATDTTTGTDTPS